MNKLNINQKHLALLLACLLLASTVLGSSNSNLANAAKKSGAKKATLKTKTLSMKVGAKKKIQIKNKKKGAKYTFTPQKKSYVSISKTGTITAKKAGTVKVTVKETYKKKKRKLGTMTIKITKKSQASTTPDTSGTNEPVPTNTPVPDTPSTPVPTPIPTAGPINPYEDTDYTTPDNFDKKKSGVTTYGTLKQISYYSTTTEKTRYANIILPAGYTTAKKYPVLYLLHGIGGDHNEWKGGNPANIIGNLVATGNAVEMIVVMPNCRARANDAGNPSDIYSVEHFAAFDNFINDLKYNVMPYINSHYSVAEGRENTAVAGLSMGGRESLYIGFSMPETFGYIGAFEPAVGVLPYSTEGGLFTESTFKLPDEYNNQTYIMIVKGKNDTTVGDAPLNYHNTLTANGTTHVFYEREGGHDFTVWKNGLYNFARRIFRWKKD